MKTTSTPNERHVAQIMARCVHFTGVSDLVCKAGVRYTDVWKEHEPIEKADSSGRPYTATRSLPCNDKLNHLGVVCAKRQAPTWEEAVERDREANEAIEFVFAARARIAEATKGKRGQQGWVECPKCCQKLMFRVASSNGHIWGKCETAGCLQWME